MHKIVRKYCSLALLTLFTLILAAPVAEAQCPMCRAGVESSMKDEDNKAVGKGLNKGILFLLASPYVLIGSALFVWRRKSKKTASFEEEEKEVEESKDEDEEKNGDQ